MNNNKEFEKQLAEYIIKEAEYDKYLEEKGNDFNETEPRPKKIGLGRKEK